MGKDITTLLDYRYQTSGQRNSFKFRGLDVQTALHDPTAGQCTERLCDVIGTDAACDMTCDHVTYILQLCECHVRAARQSRGRLLRCCDDVWVEGYFGILLCSYTLSYDTSSL